MGFGFGGGVAGGFGGGVAGGFGGGLLGGGEDPADFFGFLGFVGGFAMLV